MKKFKRWETKISTKIFCLKRQKKETWVDYHTRTSIMARNIWVKMILPILYEKLRKVCGAPWGGPAMKKRMR